MPPYQQKTRGEHHPSDEGSACKIHRQGNDKNIEEAFDLFDNKLFLMESDCYYLYKQNDLNMVFVYKNGQRNITKQINCEEFSSRKESLNKNL